jgi:hypothetical protein
MVDKLRQYNSAKMYADRVAVKIPAATSTFDLARIQAYTLYEDFFLNLPDSYRVILRGEDNAQQQIYVPTPEKIIEAICRFHAINPVIEWSTKNAELEAYFADLWDREAFVRKQTDNKRWGCVRGDSAYYLTVDENKPDGQRISINNLDPSCYFPIENPLVAGQILGCYIVDEVPKPGGKAGDKAIRRQSYMRENKRNGDGSITFTGKIIYDSMIFEQGKWDSRTLEADKIKKIGTLVPPKYMPPEIDKLPVYFIPNSAIDGSIFGRSELAGIETLVTAINQTMTDEDITLAMKGLGCYVTDAPAPRDAADKVTDWEVGPARVLEVPEGKTFVNLAGVNSVQPMLDHVNKADEFAQQGKGVPEIAVGKVDVTIAESGISLKFQLGPILAKGREKQDYRGSVETQMHYDILHKWIPAFEKQLGAIPEDLRIKIVYGDPVPKDDDKIFEMHLKIYDLGIYPTEKLYEALNAMPFGFNFEPGDFEKAQEEAKKKAESSDPFGAALANEAGNPDDPNTPPEGAPSDE